MSTNLAPRSEGAAAPLSLERLILGEEGRRARARLQTRGFTVLRHCLGPAPVRALRAEARRQESSAVVSEWYDYGLGEDGSYFSGPMCFRSANGGPWLRWLHRHPALVGAVRTLTGRPGFAPTGYRSYMYYTDGSFVHLHTDVPGCEFTVLTCVVGRVAPLVVHPTLYRAGVGPQLALAQATAGVPAGGREVPVPVGGLLFLLGRELPHRRPEVRADGRTVALATLCYGSPRSPARTANGSES